MARSRSRHSAGTCRGWGQCTRSPAFARTPLGRGLRDNLAAAANGATARGDGADASQLLDGTEATDWSAERADVAGLGVNVDLYDEVFVSPADAFPGDGMRPTAPDLNVASFAVPRTRATHLRLEVLSNQCTGGPDFQGDQDNDPANNSDCPTGRPDVAAVVTAAEFQAFAR